MRARWLYILACVVSVFAIVKLVANMVAVMPRWDYESASARISSNGEGVETARYFYRGVEYVEVATPSTAYGDVGQHTKQFNTTYNGTVWFHPMSPDKPTFGSGLSWSRALSWLAIPGFAIYAYFLGKWFRTAEATDRIGFFEILFDRGTSTASKPNTLQISVAVQAIASYLIFVQLSDAWIKAFFLFVMYSSLPALLQMLRAIGKRDNAPPEGGASVQSVAT